MFKTCVGRLWIVIKYFLFETGFKWNIKGYWRYTKDITKQFGAKSNETLLTILGR